MPLADLHAITWSVELTSHHRSKYVEFDDDYLWVILASSIGSPGLLETYCRRTGRFLWEISPRSQIARWPSHWNFCSAGLCGEQATAACSHSQPGRQAVVFHSIEDCGSDPIIRLLDWDAVHPDPKTGSLCLLSGHSLAIFPGYKSFADHTDDEGQIDRNVATDNTVFIQDGSVKEGRDLPPWMRERGGDPDSYLAVADGRAAFIAKVRDLHAPLVVLKASSLLTITHHPPPPHRTALLSSIFHCSSSRHAEYLMQNTKLVTGGSSEC